VSSVFFTYDANGNVGQLLDAASPTNILAHYEYSPFGETLVAIGELAEANPFRFSTKYHERESGLVYYGRRYYNPELGWWISRDPIGERGGKNLYCMARNRVINRFDPLGTTDTTGGSSCCSQVDIQNEGITRSLEADSLTQTNEPNHLEYCGIICCGANGNVSSTPPHIGFVLSTDFTTGQVKQRGCNPGALDRWGNQPIRCPDGTRKVSDYHSHPSNNPHPSDYDYDHDQRRCYIGSGGKVVCYWTDDNGKHHEEQVPPSKPTS
jgi:RHS repeat-associated protein